MAESAVIEIPVLPDGTLGTVALGAELDVSRGCVVRLVGEVENVNPGSYDVVSSPAVKAGQAGWNFEPPSADRRAYRMRVVDGAVRVTVGKFGMTMVVF